MMACDRQQCRRSHLILHPPQRPRCRERAMCPPAATSPRHRGATNSSPRLACRRSGCHKSSGAGRHLIAMPGTQTAKQLRPWRPVLRRLQPPGCSHGLPRGIEEAQSHHEGCKGYQCGAGWDDGNAHLRCGGSDHEYRRHPCVHAGGSGIRSRPAAPPGVESGGLASSGATAAAAELDGFLHPAGATVATVFTSQPAGMPEASPMEQNLEAQEQTKFLKLLDNFSRR